MIDFEVHGELHYTDKCIAKDKRRKEFLESKGWTVIELRWSHYLKLSYEQKQAVLNDLLTKITPVSTMASTLAFQAREVGSKPSRGTTI